MSDKCSRQDHLFGVFGLLCCVGLIVAIIQESAGLLVLSGAGVLAFKLYAFVRRGHA